MKKDQCVENALAEEMLMAEDVYVFTGPNGQQVRCVASQLMKDPGNDLWGRPLHAQIAKRLGV